MTAQTAMRADDRTDNRNMLTSHAAQLPHVLVRMTAQTAVRADDRTYDRNVLTSAEATTVLQQSPDDRNMLTVRAAQTPYG